MTTCTCACLLTITWTYLAFASETCAQSDGGGALMQRGHPNLLDRRLDDMKGRSASSWGKATLEGANMDKPAAPATENAHGKQKWIFEGKDSPGSWGSGALAKDQHGIADTAQDDAGRQAGFGGPDNSETNTDIDDLILEPENVKQESLDSAPETSPAGVYQSAVRQDIGTQDDPGASQVDIVQDGHEDASLLHDRRDKLAEEFARSGEAQTSELKARKPSNSPNGYSPIETNTAPQMQEGSLDDEKPLNSPNGYSPVETNTAPNMQEGSLDDGKPPWMTQVERVQEKETQGITTDQSLPVARSEHVSARGGDDVDSVRHNVANKGELIVAGDAAGKKESNDKIADAGSPAPGTSSAANPSILESQSNHEKEIKLTEPVLQQKKLTSQSTSSSMFPGDDPDFNETQLTENDTLSNEAEDEMDGYYRTDDPSLAAGLEKTWSRRDYGINHQQQYPEMAYRKQHQQQSQVAHGLAQADEARMDVARSRQHLQGPPPISLPDSAYEAVYAAGPRTIAKEVASTGDDQKVYAGNDPVDDKIEAGVDTPRIPPLGMEHPLQGKTQYGRFPANDLDNEDNSQQANGDAENENVDDGTNVDGKVIYAAEQTNPSEKLA